MTSCLSYLAQNPVDRQRLIDDPSLIREAIEEILRRYSVVNPVRTATRDFEYRGVQIKAKDQFLISTILANLDDRAIEDPTSVDLVRDPNPHLAFGGGPHRCAGSHLARIELRVLLEEALPRLKNLRLQDGAHLHWHAANLVGLSSLPLQWDVD
jgi:cytochrome P450